MDEKKIEEFLRQNGMLRVDGIKAKTGFNIRTITAMADLTENTVKVAYTNNLLGITLPNGRTWIRYYEYNHNNNEIISFFSSNQMGIEYNSFLEFLLKDVQANMEILLIDILKRIRDFDK